MLTEETIRQALKYVIKKVDLPNLKDKQQGKVRDIYRLKKQRLLITTDRISAFDRILGYIPYKGQVLNQLAAFWFDKTIYASTNLITVSPKVQLSDFILPEASSNDTAYQNGVPYLSNMTNVEIVHPQTQKGNTSTNPLYKFDITNPGIYEKDRSLYPPRT